MRSEKGKINSRDLIKGALLTSVTALLSVLYESLLADTFNIENIGKVALITFVGYIVKNLTEDEKGEI